MKRGTSSIIYKVFDMTFPAVIKQDANSDAEVEELLNKQDSKVQEWTDATDRQVMSKTLLPWKDLNQLNFMENRVASRTPNIWYLFVEMWNLENEDAKKENKPTPGFKEAFKMACLMQTPATCERNHFEAVVPRNAPPKKQRLG